MEWNGNGMELKWKHSSDKVYMIVYRKWEWSRQKKQRNFLYDVNSIVKTKWNLCGMVMEKLWKN